LHFALWNGRRRFGLQRTGARGFRTHPAAEHFELNGKQIARLNNLAPAAGERNNEGNMAVIAR
jgi:hypothetical protein